MERDHVLRETGFNPFVLKCITKMQANVRRFQARARVKRRYARERNMRVMRNAVMSAARLAVNRKEPQPQPVAMPPQPSEADNRATREATLAIQKLAEQVEDLESKLQAEKASRANVGRELAAEKQLRKGLEEKVAAMERANELLADELKRLQASLYVSTEEVETQFGPGQVDRYSTGTDTTEHPSVVKEALEKLNGERNSYGIGQVDIDAVLHQVFTWLWAESDLYVLKPDGYRDSGTGHVRGDAEAKVLAAFAAAGPLRPHPSVDDSWFRAPHGATIPRGEGVQHVDLGDFQSSLGLERGSGSLVMLSPNSSRQRRSMATPPQSPNSGRRPVLGSHRFEVGSQQIKGEKRTPVPCALLPVAPGERVLQLNIEAVHESVARCNSQMRLNSRGSPRSPRLKSRGSPRGRPSLQAHSDGSGSLPSALNELVHNGVIGALKPKLVVNWDLDHLQQRRPDSSSTFSRGRHDHSTAPASAQASRSLCSQPSLVRSSAVPVQSKGPTSRGLLGAGMPLSDMVPADQLPPPMQISNAP